ncbi:MAG: hypothetical protein D6812_16070, partial [Deltaproteobacteria bacterium]
QAARFAQQCSKCHTIGQGDRVGPDLKDVTKRRKRDWLIGFITAPGRYLDTDPIARKLLERYNGVRMAELGLSRSEAEAMIAYIETVSEGGGGVEIPRPLLPEKKDRRIAGPGPRGPLHRGGLVALGIVVLLGLVAWGAGYNGLLGTLGIVAVFLLYWSLGGYRYHHLWGNDQGYEPQQPIAFSHALHAGEMEISCLYCHSGAERGPVAGVPAVGVCMNCHRIVDRRRGQEHPSPEIAKIRAAWESRKSDTPKPIRWVRVHQLPAFVTFTHEAHVRNGITCQECHGPVQEMERIRQVSDLTMGWCVNCHRKEGVEVPTHWLRSQASTDCNICHQ